MKLSSALPLVVAAKLLVPANSAVADEPQDLSDVSDRVNFNPDNGELTLEGLEGLSPAERERALASVLGGFRQLVDGCFDGGSSSDTYSDEGRGKVTVDCGNGVSVSSCTFKRGLEDGEFLSCEFPGGEGAGFKHTTSFQSRKVPGLKDDCGRHFGCVERIIGAAVSFFGTNTVDRGFADGLGPLLTFRDSKTEITGRGQRGDISWDLVRYSAGPDSFGDVRANDELLGKVVSPFVTKIGEEFDAIEATNRALQGMPPAQRGHKY